MENPCPCCASIETEVASKDVTISAPFGPARTCRTTAVVCYKCGATTVHDDSAIEPNLRESENLSCQKIIAELEEAGMGIPSTLRVLRMPMSLIKEWKEGRFSPEAASLLRCLKVFILDTAESPNHVMNMFGDFEVELDKNTSRIGTN